MQRWTGGIRSCHSGQLKWVEGFITGLQQPQIDDFGMSAPIIHWLQSGCKEIFNKWNNIHIHIWIKKNINTFLLLFFILYLTHFTWRIHLWFLTSADKNTLVFNKKKRQNKTRDFKRLQGRSTRLSQRNAYPHLPSHYTDNCSLKTTLCKCWSILSAYNWLAAHACI